MYIYIGVNKIGDNPLPRGRLSITCHSGTDFRKRDSVISNLRIDPYIKFRIGMADRYIYIYIFVFV
jgi:hypothetical protein